MSGIAEDGDAVHSIALRGTVGDYLRYSLALQFLFVLHIVFVTRIDRRIVNRERS